MPSSPFANPSPGSPKTLTPAIQVADLELVYASRAEPFQALSQINLTVAAGELCMIVGPAGAGKTTLLLVIAGLLTPTRGHISVFGQELTALTRSQLTQFRLQTMGLIFAEDNLLHSMTALENVEVALNLKGITGPSGRREARSLLESVGLGDKTHHLPRQLSGGQLQRVAIARGLAGHPALIIADEPTAALDSENGQHIGQLLQERSRQSGCTVLVATHDPRILSFGDRILTLEDGKLSNELIA